MCIRDSLKTVKIPQDDGKKKKEPEGIAYNVPGQAQITLKMCIRDSYNIEEELQAKELNNYIDKIIEELPPKQQEIFILSDCHSGNHCEQ